MPDDKHDILGELLCGVSESDESEQLIDELADFIYRTEIEDNNIDTDSNKDLNDNKKKATHYLAEKIFNELGSAKDEIKKILPKGSKHLVSKSEIVNIALRKILDEFSKNKEQSRLVQHILSQIKSNRIE